MDPLISFCVTVKNRAGNLLRLANSLRCIEAPGPVELVVADYASTDADWPAMFEEFPWPVTVVSLTHAPFNRSQGLNVATAYSNGSREDLYFFLDADMIVPVDFAQRVRTFCRPSWCWFPICYSLHKSKPPVVDGDSRNPHLANGWWRREGRGMCGFCYRDFAGLGGWNERIGVTYGGEDGDLGRRAARTLRAHRELCYGLFHVYHPTTTAFRTQHHLVMGMSRRLIGVKPPSPVVSAWHNRQATEQGYGRASGDCHAVPGPRADARCDPRS